MSGPSHPIPDRLLELLADEAAGQLSETERAEMDALLTNFGHEKPAPFDLLLGSLLSSMKPGTERLPNALARRLESVGRAQIGAPSLKLERLVDDAPLPTSVGRVSRPSPSAKWTRYGWAAAAGLLLVAAAGWWPRIFVEKETSIVLSPPHMPDAYDRLESLTTHGVDVMTVAVAPGNDSAGDLVSGHVHWSSRRQEGYLQARGMLPNKPVDHTYQLWMFDSSNPSAGPVSAGTFDVPFADCVPEAMQVVIPITPKFQIASPSQFAVTIEKPGGAPTPTLTRLVLTAKVQ